MTILAIIEVIAFRDHWNNQEIPMTIRTSLLALIAIATLAATSLTPANAGGFGPRHFARFSHQFAFVNRVPPGVLPCKRGIVYVCQ
jgi:hypothetical protein